MPLESKYIKAIYAAARETGCDNEALHDAIFAGWQKKSVKELTTQEAWKLLDGMRGGKAAVRRKASSTHGRKAQPVGTHFLVTARERKMLQQAAELRGWNLETLAAFTTRQLKSSEIRTLADFNKVFWPLKRMNRADGMGETERISKSALLKIRQEKS